MVKERPQRNFRRSLLVDLRQIGGEVVRDVDRRGWCTDRDDARRFRHVRRRRKHRRPAQAVADQQRRRGVVLSQIVGCRDEILDIGREVGVRELTLAAAYPGEVEPQYGNAASCESFGNPRGRKDVLAAGEAMGEQRKARGFRRQIERRAARSPPEAPGKLDSSLI